MYLPMESYKNIYFKHIKIYIYRYAFSLQNCNEKGCFIWKIFHATGSESGYHGAVEGKSEGYGVTPPDGQPPGRECFWP